MLPSSILRSHSAIGQTAHPIAVEIAHPETKGHRVVFLRRFVIIIDETKMVKPCPPCERDSKNSYQ
jgi:hypothetical protein